jgi:hypothetical protein
VFSPHQHLHTFTTTTVHLITTVAPSQPTFARSQPRSQPLSLHRDHVHNHCSPHCNHTTAMTLTCAARHLCALPNVPIPIKLPGNKSDTSPSAPDEPKHICEHCRKPMHGGICGQNFKDVHDILDKTKLHHKDTNEINPIATISASYVTTTCF